MIGVYRVFLLCLLSASTVNAQGVLTDPTRPALYAKKITANKAETYKSEFKVSQIYTDTKKRLAIINGQKVTIGESVDNARVAAINSTSVNLLVNGEITKVSIMPSFKQYNSKQYNSKQYKKSFNDN